MIITNEKGESIVAEQITFQFDVGTILITEEALYHHLVVTNRKELPTEVIVNMQRDLWKVTQNCSEENMKKACEEYLAFLKQRWFRV